MPASSLTYDQVLALDQLWKPHFQELVGTDCGDLGYLNTQPYLLSRRQTSLMAGLHARVSKSPL